jgi:hypothetical protein
MALTRKLLKGMGLTDEQVDTIIEAHGDTVDGLKEDIQRYKADAEKLPGVQKELDDLKKDNGNDFKARYEKERQDFQAYKDGIAKKEAAAAKEKAARAYFESKGIPAKSMGLVIRGAKGEIESLELDGEKIKDASALDSLLDGDYKGHICNGHVGVFSRFLGVPAQTAVQRSSEPGNGLHVVIGGQPSRFISFVRICHNLVLCCNQVVVLLCDFGRVSSNIVDILHKAFPASAEQRFNAAYKLFIIRVSFYSSRGQRSDCASGDGNAFCGKFHSTDGGGTDFRKRRRCLFCHASDFAARLVINSDFDKQIKQSGHLPHLQSLQVLL